MAAQPKKKTSRVRSKTRRAHRHDAIRDENLWQSGMLPKKERRELYAQYRRRRSLQSTTTPTPKATDTKPTTQVKTRAATKTTHTQLKTTKGSDKKDPK